MATRNCPKGDGRVTLDEVVRESYLSQRGEVVARVEYLSCGHKIVTDEEITGGAPGAPFTGTEVQPWG